MEVNKSMSKKLHAQGSLDNFLVIVSKESKGESLIFYNPPFQHNELALVDINSVHFACQNSH